MADLPKACIVGAGASGIAAVKALDERGIPFDCFERSDRVGGLWAIDAPDSTGTAYESLHINTSKPVMSYSDFPVPDDIPDFPHVSHIERYLNDYVDHFGVRERITFGTEVARAHRRPSDGVFEVALGTGETREYDALLVANGHHWDPSWPDPPVPGEFDGVQMHSHDFRTAKGWEGKRVVVVGMGNSAMDIAVEASYIADRVLLSARRGAYIIPNYLFGKPADHLLGSWINHPRLPRRVRFGLTGLSLRLAHGRPEDYGLPKPDHRFGEAHPTVSNYMLTRIAHGEVEPKPTIERLEGDRVRFADGSVEQADIVVYCTGYRVTFPFLDPGFWSAPDNEMPVFKLVFPFEIPNLAFLGFVQPWGAIMPIAERQAQWVAAYLRAEYALPPARAMRRDYERRRRAMKRRYVGSKRHTMQVEQRDYLWDLDRELAVGRARAEARGGALPVPPRAADAPGGPGGGEGAGRAEAAAA